MGQNTLVHYGIPGMKWGVRRTPEQLWRQNTKLKKKVVRYDLKAGKFAKKQAKYTKKLAKVQRRVYDFSATKKDYKKGRKFSKKLAKMSVKSAKFQAKAAHAREKIYKNETLIEMMETKTSTLSEAKIAAGKAYVDEERGESK